MLKFCRTYYELLYGYARRRGNSPQDARDLTLPRDLDHLEIATV